MDKIVIIGGVAAGATAAAKIRRISAKTQITMIESGPDISFANCGLPYFIGGDIKNRSQLILQSPESFKDQYDVDVFTNVQVSSIDKFAHSIIAINSRTGEKLSFEYSKLILAQGGRPVTPAIPGADLGNVFTLWTLEDMDKIAFHLEEKKPKNAVVVGGGFIGLEMVEALAKRGLKVHVIEMMPHVMGIMEAEIAGFIEREMLSYGVEIHTNVGVSAIMPGSVRLENGLILKADMVLLSIGVRPTIQLAMETGLALGDAGGLLVNSYLQTSDPDIYAAGDMIEIEHRVNGRKVRIPLAGPANRQGRIAAENALGGSHTYKGALGTSIVRVFDAIVGITGISIKQARAAGIEADSVVVHKEHHTSYYPGAEMVTLLLVYDRNTGIILGGQTAGYKGADKRLDVIAMATATKLSIYDLADIDFAYSPPIGTANDALNMAAYTAENKVSGFSPSVTAAELDQLIEHKNPFFIDVRDYFSFEKNHIEGANNIPIELIQKHLQSIPTERLIVVYDETGKKGHQALRKLIGAGFSQVINVSGGFISLQRHAQVMKSRNFKLDVLPVTSKLVSSEKGVENEVIENQPINEDIPIIVDVRTIGEFKMGAYPNAVNIPLDELPKRFAELGHNLSRDITVYCASGARSTYAENLLRQMGYQNIKNGGGLSTMIASINKFSGDNDPIIIDVRTPQEFKSGAVPGAVNIPLDELSKHIDKLGSFTRDITVYCASGGRSAYAQKFLKESGFSDVKNGGGIALMMMSRNFK